MPVLLLMVSGPADRSTRGTGKSPCRSSRLHVASQNMASQKPGPGQGHCNESLSGAGVEHVVHAANIDEFLGPIGNGEDGPSK